MNNLTPEHLAPVVGLCNDTEWYLQIRRKLESRGVKPEIPLSVVIPYYKRPLTLRQTLLSLRKSSYNLDLVEFVIADDGSDSRDRPNLEEFLNLGLNVKYVWQQDLGFRLSAVRNLGVSCASHDNIVILDCDLVVSEDFLLEHAWPLSISKNIVSIGLRENRIYEGSNTDIFASKDPSEIGEFEKEDWRLSAWIDKVPNFELSDTCWKMSSGGNIGFHKSILDRAGNFSERFTFWGGEDLEWGYRAFKAGAYFLINRGAYAFHFESKSSEFQVDRSQGSSEKENLLKQLVPVRKPAYMCTDGEVPYVSIFMTLYNKAEHLAEAIISVDKATKYRYEIVIVDDGSSDNYAQVLDDLPARLKAKVVVRERKHEGAEKTYRDCLSLCRGEFIAQLDADDLLLPGSIDRLINALEDSIADVAYGRYKKFSASPQKAQEGWTHPICDRYLSIYKGMHTHPLRVFRARALGRVGGFRILNIKAAVDFSLYSQILLASCGIFVDEDTYLYRLVNTSLSASKPDIQTRNTRDVVEDNIKRMISIREGGGYALTERRSKCYEITIDPSAKHLVYLDHLGLKHADHLSWVAGNPAGFIHPKMLRAQTNLQIRRVKIRDKVTNLEFDVDMGPSDFARYYKESLKKSATNAPSYVAQVKIGDL